MVEKKKLPANKNPTICFVYYFFTLFNYPLLNQTVFEKQLGPIACSDKIQKSNIA